MTNDFFVKFRQSTPPFSDGFYDQLFVNRDIKGLRYPHLKKRAELQNEEEIDPLEPLRAVLDDFFSNFLSLSETVTVMSALGIALTQLGPVAEVEKYLKANGTKIKERPRYKVYSVDEKHRSEALHLIRRRARLVKGSELIPRGILSTIIAVYDEFLYRTIIEIYRAKPEAAKGIDRKFSMKELLEFRTISQARMKITEKEAESVLRESHSKHFEILANRFGITLDPDKLLLARFMEVCERRNVFTHNGGIVTQSYIDNGAKYGFDVSNHRIGSKLKLDDDYLLSSLETVFEIGFQLAQATWRQIFKGNLAIADNAAVTIPYELLKQDKFSLAARILDYCSGIKTWSEAGSKLMCTVNRANAHKLNGNSDLSKSIIASESWHTMEPSFQISIAAISDDVVDCMALLQKYGNKIGVSPSEFLSWPAFRTIRDNDEFQQAFRQAFGSELFESLEEGDEALIGHDEGGNTPEPEAASEG